MLPLTLWTRPCSTSVPWPSSTRTLRTYPILVDSFVIWSWWPVWRNKSITTTSPISANNFCLLWADRQCGGYLGWEGDLGRGKGAVIVDGRAYPLFWGAFSGMWRRPIGTKTAPVRTGARQRSTSGRGEWHPGAATVLKYTMPVHLESHIFCVYNRKGNKRC